MTFYCISITPSSFQNTSHSPEEIDHPSTYSVDSEINFISSLSNRKLNYKIGSYEYSSIKFGETHILNTTSNGDSTSPKKYFTIKNFDGTEISARENSIDETLKAIFTKLQATIETQSKEKS
jgi:hypothetical protein